MTSTNYYQGLNAGKNSSKVLKPPGGGSSDIFGSAEQAAQRRVKNHFASSVFLSDEPSTPSTPARSPGNSHNRLFGPASPPKSTPRANKSVSRILPLDDVPASNGNFSTAKTPTTKTVINGDAHDGAETPATPNGNTSPTTNGNRITNGGTSPAPAPAAPRQRVPPGGYSSGLW